MDAGLVLVVTGVVLVVLLGGAALRPYDAPDLDPRPALLPVYLLRSLARLAVAYVLAVTLVAWVFFRADTLSGALGMLRAMVGLSPGVPTAYSPSWYLTPELLLAMCAGAIGATPALHAAARVNWRQGRRLQPALVNVALVVLFLASVMLVAARTYNPFIYFRF